MFVYEREQDGALVIGAGLADAWVLDPAGVEVSHLPTYYGTLDYTVKATPAREVVVTIGGSIAMPPGGIVLKSPLARPIRSLRGDGSMSSNNGGEIRIGKLPATVSISY